MSEQTISNQDLPFWAIIFTMMLCALFGANAVAIKITLSGLGVFTTAGLRFGMASIAVSIWAWAVGKPFSIKKGQIYQILIISMVFMIQLSLFYLGLSKTHASRGTLLVNLQPFFVLLLAHFFIAGDRITPRKFLGMTLGFVGVAFVFLEKKGISTDFQVGDLIILFAAFLWAGNAVYTKRIIGAFNPFHMVLYPMLFSVPFFFLEGFLWDGTMIAHVDGKILGALLYQGLVTASFGFVAWMTLLQKYGAVELHSFIFVMPVSGVLLGGLMLGEPITYKILLALFLIVSGILVVHLKQKTFPPVFPMGRNV
ncbi:MAG: DMT family transporter [Deltaproteobacteria bacterium]|nr:DMT family transporter [Deltaproteobacteria bacterium]